MTNEYPTFLKALQESMKIYPDRVGAQLQFLSKFKEALGQNLIFPRINFRAEQLTPELQNAISRFARIEQRAKSIKSIFEGVSEDIKIIRRVLPESGWWLAPSILHLPAGLVTEGAEAARNYINGQKDAIDNFFVNICQKDDNVFLKKMVKKWDKNTYFKSWLNIINDTLWAHTQEKYTLSVPTLLLAIEGIATKYCETNIGSVKNIRSKGKEKIRRALERAKNNNKQLDELMCSGFLLGALDNVIYKDTELMERDAKNNYAIYLNRHAIIHGLSHDYGTLRNSLQCFMILDVLSLLS